MFGKLTEMQIEEVLYGHFIGRIGCHADNTTYIVPISYAYDGQFIYAHTEEGMKIDMMRKNRNICFEVDSLQNMANWQSVIAWGEYEELRDDLQRHQALEKLHERILPMVPSATAKLSPEWPFAPENTNQIKGIVFRIRLFKKTGRFENNTVPSFLAWG